MDGSHTTQTRSRPPDRDQDAVGPVSITRDNVDSTFCNEMLLSQSRRLIREKDAVFYFTVTPPACPLFSQLARSFIEPRALTRFGLSNRFRGIFGTSSSEKPGTSYTFFTPPGAPPHGPTIMSRGAGMHGPRDLKT
jgi:hypothetical protein